jgi:hypothetical protein
MDRPKSGPEHDSIQSMQMQIVAAAAGEKEIKIHSTNLTQH